MKYKTIVIDPPWKMGFMVLKMRPNQKEMPYDMLLHSTLEPRIDIFSRKKHQGFDSWGNECEEPLTLMSYVTKRGKC